MRWSVAFGFFLATAVESLHGQLADSLTQHGVFLLELQIVESRNARPIVKADLLLYENGTEVINRSKSDSLPFYLELSSAGNYRGEVSCERHMNDIFEIKAGQYPPGSKATVVVEPLRFIACPTIDLPVIYFEQDSVELPLDSRVQLAQLVDFARTNPTATLEIGGHVDFEEPEDLGIDRAQVVWNYLVKLGISKERLLLKGWGSTAPLIAAVEMKKLTTNVEVEAAMRLNRRVDVRIISFGWPVFDPKR